MHFEINVSLNGKHFFATDPRSCTSKDEFIVVFTAIQERFLPKDGFAITCSSSIARGYTTYRNDLSSMNAEDVLNLINPYTFDEYGNKITQAHADKLK